MITLGFYGAAGTVTGSKYLIDVNGRRLMIDCGMFQGTRELRQRNWTPPPFEAKSVEAVALTHGHIDHIGYLPRFVKDGFHGWVYCTPPTQDIARISLLDTAELQVEDADFRNRKKLTRHEKALPLFTPDDVEDAMRLFEPVEFGKWVSVGDEIKFRYHSVGHLLGAACVEVVLTDIGRQVRVLFSGDIGRYGNPLVRNPDEPPQFDYLICESTYGGRLHPAEDPYFQFDTLLDEVEAGRRVLLVPAFAFGRTQQVVFLIDDLIRHKRIKPIEVNIDSPMAVAATDVYVKYYSYNSDEEPQARQLAEVLEGRRVNLCRTKAQSKMLNQLSGPTVIISSSGMLTGGRILHHLINRLPDPSTIVALVGYMAEGTLGRKLLDGEKLVYIHKQPVDVRAKIEVIPGLSGHADYSEILHWLEPITQAPRRVFVTHGEPDQSAAMAEHLQKERGWDTLIPTLDQIVEL